ncbi:FAD-dependent monooxygenase [Gordonia sp. KTR9]|uniref:FAD-dependent monooxygenase n=1 Tax=Gordonia sp. KTR9 TaxID=337191 RepID=UPI00027DE9A4|nr:FAD-dependent monooxygenase [Gordonia sp. KTR9]AFR51077.1 FAD-dependent monooxygenase-like protein [Gordonia sp. KTR9]
MTTVADVEVVVIGGGPTGLALTLDLGRRGIRTVVVDRGLAPLPGVRAGGLSARMMEHLRRLGVAPILKDVAPLQPGWPKSNILTTRLAGHLVGEFTPSETTLDFLSFAAEMPQNAPSWLVESAIRGLLVEEPTVETLFGWQFRDDLVDLGDCVEIGLEGPNGAVRRISAAYVVAADGANSRVRRTAGIEVEGSARFDTRWTVEFRSVLLRHIMGKGRHNGYNFTNADVSGGVLQQDATSLWTMHFHAIAPGVDRDPRTLIRLAVGADVPVEWTSELTQWHANAFSATTLVKGRVLLVGDAAHAMPPGGYGLHLGNSDAADLAWRLDAVLRGWGGRTVLDALDAERLPLGRAYVGMVDTSGNAPSAPADAELDTPEGTAVRIAWEAAVREGVVRQMERLATSLFDTVGPSPLILRDDTDPLDWSRREEVVPGRRLPHSWLADGRSLFDVLGPGFTIVYVDDAAGDAATLLTAARDRGIPTTAVRVDRLDPITRVALVRPDHVVAWRSSDACWDPQHVVAAVVGAAVPVDPASATLR